jgi:hypothetical protein
VLPHIHVRFAKFFLTEQGEAIPFRVFVIAKRNEFGVSQWSAQVHSRKAIYQERGET